MGCNCRRRGITVFEVTKRDGTVARFLTEAEAKENADVAAGDVWRKVTR
ncbi:hypothetical protein SEA_JKSYNGBOY_18 [Gordonia phage JKSyngboy]|uniref:Uncharacterized protein n=3 Tax=Kroosvirus TaxID=2948789 RepID=A0A3G3M881_9CAUD|nr:hypothetical protein J1762_gp18 [Gordonia phage JKSyngboy]YP_010001984.1 hypothetical protein J1766_gp20 [Gordonia phage Bizzy]YP_010002068.1 hypothetical protein J1767_gp19 [Gordonia phage Tangerine]UAJ15687.1 hypothetical protein SEA_BADDON_19 [Gordonia phage Baddon]URP21087.1 hypothetical protein SEA_FLATWOODS_20 [Gordonia phage Flatwoods]WMI33029.1 hypothetical protein SEA_SCHOTTB_18 [Gordonia Phage SchottB]AYR02656.1 hypothetical protein SEA_BIZZY_20 [Gordonia phage Bizzy]QDM57318.1 